MRYTAARAAAAILVLAAASFSLPSVAGPPAPVVVELFTSQGCNSCPPADELLGELAGRDDVLALSFHVTYWDRLGWPDTFGLEAGTLRQHDYARSLGESRVYTPQMVLDGRLHVVGNNRARVMQAIELLAIRRAAGPAIEIGGDTVRVGSGRVGSGRVGSGRIGSGQAESGNAGGATLWLVAFDRFHDVEVGRGENAGRTLRYHHVVQDLEPLARWRGEPLQATLPLARLERAGRAGVALLLQDDGSGRILNATTVEFGDPG